MEIDFDKIDDKKVLKAIKTALTAVLDDSIRIDNKRIFKRPSKITKILIAEITRAEAREIECAVRRE